MKGVIKTAAAIGQSTNCTNCTYINGRRVLLSEDRLESRFAAFGRRVRRLLVFCVILVTVGLWIKRRAGRDAEVGQRGEVVKSEVRDVKQARSQHLVAGGTSGVRRAKTRIQSDSDKRF